MRLKENKMTGFYKIIQWIVISASHSRETNATVHSHLESSTTEQILAENTTDESAVGKFFVL